MIDQPVEQALGEGNMNKARPWWKVIQPLSLIHRCQLWYYLSSSEEKHRLPFSQFAEPAAKFIDSGA